MPYKNVALFDLDHTLLPLDSDNEWIEFLARHHLAGDPLEVQRRNAEIFQKYNAGTLSIEESTAFVLSFLKMHSVYDLVQYHERFMHEVIRPVIFPQAYELVAKHMQAGDLCCLVSATNHWVIGPIARAFGFEHVIGTQAEYVNGAFTGRFIGIPSYKEGKITRVNAWLESLSYRLEDFEQSYFYSDSINDFPLMNIVTHPVATNPHAALLEKALQLNWSIIKLFE